MANKQFNSVDGYSVGNASIVIDANRNVSGNLITATANVTAPQLISNVATGTAPFVVTSTTQVANLSVATAGSATTAGTVTTAAQPNITSVGTLSSLAITSGAATKLAITANAVPTSDMVTITNAGQGVTSAGVNGIALTYVGGAAAVEASAYRTDFTPGGTTGGTWNGYRFVAASNAASGVTMNAIKIDNITGGAGTENMIFAGTGWDNILNYNGTSVIFGNGTVNASQVTGTVSSATTAGTVTTAAQPNITSVGTLTSLGVNGTITGVNITANTGVFTGNGSGLSALNASNISTGTLAQARLANSTLTLGNTTLTLGATTTTVTGLSSVTSTTFVGSLSGAATTAGTVTTAAQPNITSVGTLTSLTVSGNVNIDSNTLFVDSTNNFVGIGTNTSSVGVNLEVASNANSLGGFLLVRNANTGTNSATGIQVQAGNRTALLQVSSSNAQFGTTSNIPLNIIANSSNAMTIIATGNVGIANTAPTHTLSVTGTLNVSGNANVGNIGATNFVGSLTGAATTAGTVTTAAQPNITSVGTLTSLTVSGNANFDSGTLFVDSVNNEVGIGTTNPLANLDIRGNARIQSNIAYVSPNGSNTINSTMLNGGTLAWSGNAGQLFSITDSMTGNIFTVNDVSGIPMISVDAGGNIQFAASGGFVNYGVTTAITAAGSTQGTATILTRPIGVVSTVANGANGIILPTVPAGARIIIVNTSANALNVYPPSGAVVNSGSTNAAYSQPAGARLEYFSVSTTQWYTLNATYG